MKYSGKVICCRLWLLQIQVFSSSLIIHCTAPSAPPDNVEHINVTDVSVSFAWDEVPCGSRRGNIIDYSYELRTSLGDDIKSDTTSARSLSFTELLPCTDYIFKVAARTSVDIGPYSNLTLATSTKGILLHQKSISNGLDLYHTMTDRIHFFKFTICYMLKAVFNLWNAYLL